MHEIPTLEPVRVERAPAAPGRSRRSGPLRRFLSAAFGWAWRLGFGTFCGTNYFFCILLTGWLYRWVQGQVLYGWWKQSRLAREGSFADFRASLGPDAPVTRPRWLLRENFVGEQMRVEVNAPTVDGEPPLPLRKLARMLVAPFRGFWLNLRTGLLALLATFLVTGWGCLFMTFSWEFGWLNSFNKGYEQAAVGPLLGVGGIVLFVLALCYMPMAQVHQAVTGDFWAFFDVRFVGQLVRARLTAYVVLAAAFAGLGLVLEILKTAPVGFDDHIERYTLASDAEVLKALRQYYFVCSFVLLLSLLLTRWMGARVYRSAVLKALRRGRVTPERLHPRLADWLGRLDLLPTAEPPAQGILRVVRIAGRRNYRRLLFGLLFLLWSVFVLQAYVGEFFNYHPYVGFLNRPLVQAPCFDYVPRHLEQAVKTGRPAE